MLPEFIEVHQVGKDLWAWSCHDCMTSGDYAPDEVNAEYEAEHHYTMHHTDLQPWEVEVPC